MNIKRLFCLVVSLFAFNLQLATADTTKAPAADTTPSGSTAEVRNNVTLPIVIGEGGAPATIAPKESFISKHFPQTTIVVEIPENSGIRYIRINGQGNECNYPVCVMVH
jgi:hypothetical protein